MNSFLGNSRKCPLKKKLSQLDKRTFKISLILQKSVIAMTLRIILLTKWAHLESILSNENI